MPSYKGIWQSYTNFDEDIIAFNDWHFIVCSKAFIYLIQFEFVLIRRLTKQIIYYFSIYLEIIIPNFDLILKAGAMLVFGCFSCPVISCDSNSSDFEKMRMRIGTTCSLSSFT